MAPSLACGLLCYVFPPYSAQGNVVQANIITRLLAALWTDPLTHWGRTCGQNIFAAVQFVVTTLSIIFGPPLAAIAPAGEVSLGPSVEVDSMVE